MSWVARVARRLGHALLVVVLVVVGSTILVRCAPGYLSDAREMDSRYAAAARVELSTEAARSNSLPRMIAQEVGGWTRGSLGISRQYDVPVLELVTPRLAATGSLLLRSIALAWALAFCVALLSSAGRRASLLWQMPSTLLLAVPTAAMATVCLLADHGGPLLVMTLLIAARDFKFLDRILRKTWRDPHLLQARAQGLTAPRLIMAHIVPGIAPQLLALATLSIVTALSALVPVEVIFSAPGLGQLAWSAAMNRDLPVLLAATVMMAIAVTFAGMVSDGAGQRETEQWQTA